MEPEIKDALTAADNAEAQGDVDGALRLLRQVSSRPDAPAESWYRLGRLLADLGRHDEARSALQGALNRDAAHVSSLELLVDIAISDQDPDIARPYLDEAARLGVPDAIIRPMRMSLHRVAEQPPPPEDLLPEPPDLEVYPDDADLARFMAFFGGREDVYARQWYSSGKDKGGYSPVHEPMTPSVLRRHFLGEITLGVYPIRLDGTCLFAAMDIDIPSQTLDAARADSAFAKRLAIHLQQATIAIRNLLREHGFTVIVEDSGYKGRHLWLPFESPVPAKLLKELGELFIWSLTPDHLDRSMLTCEFFPKQSEARGKGLGNLIKLPLGIHRRSGRRSVFLDDNLTPIKRPFTYLRALVRTPASCVFSAIEHLQAQKPSAPAMSPNESKPQESIDVLPAPPTPAPAWTEADFDTDPDVSFLLSACPVLKDVVRQALDHKTLSREARLVLRHTLGHTPSGLLAYNFLHDRTSGADMDRLVSVLRGNPVSCAKVRSRLPEVVARVTCACEFPWAEGTYPNPLLHLEDPSRPAAIADDRDRPAPEAVLDIETEVRRFTQLVRRLRELEVDRDRLARRLATALRALPDACVRLAEGTLSLSTADNIEVIEWTPTAKESQPVEQAPDEPLQFQAPAFRIRTEKKVTNVDMTA